jgi:hypothetical protein
MKFLSSSNCSHIKNHWHKSDFTSCSTRSQEVDQTAADDVLFFINDSNTEVRDLHEHRNLIY